MTSIAAGTRAPALARTAGLFFGYPVVALLGRGLVDGGTLQWSAFADVLGRSRFQRIALFTLWQAALSAVICLLLGLPVAHLLHRCRFRGRGVLRAVLTVPFVLPTVVTGLAYRTLFAQNGPLGSWGWDGSLAAILVAHVAVNLVVVVRTVGGAWAGLPDEPAQAARTLGAGPVRVFVTVTLPALAPAVLGAATLVFLFCATSFGIMLVMGGGRYRTLETEIYRQTVDLLDLRTAAVLSLVQIVLVVAVLALAARLRRRAEQTFRPAGRLPVTSARSVVPAAVVTAGAMVLVVAPLVVMVLRSLRTPEGTGLAWYRALGELGADSVTLVPVTTALLVSLRAAALAAVGAVLVGLALSTVLARRPRRRRARQLLGVVDGVMMLPLGVSAVTVGFGFLVAFDAPPVDWRGSAWLVPVAQGLVTLPLVVRMVLPVLRAVDDRLRQAAAVLGSSPLRVWRDVDLPVVARAFGGAAAFAFVVALGEFGATSFLATPQQPTLPVVIGRLLSRPGAEATGTALAAATVLALLCTVVALVVERVASRAGTADRIGGF